MNRFFTLFVFACFLTTLSEIRANPLIQAQAADLAEQKNWAACRELLTDSLGLKPQADGMTALHWAAFHGDSATVRAALKAGIPVEEATYYGVTPVNVAAQQGHSRILAILIDASANVNAASPSGATPLMYAARAGHVDCVEVLLKGSANVDSANRQKQTALMWASAAGRAECVRRLLEAEADSDVALASGFTAFTLAAREGHSNVIRVFLEHGSDVNFVMQPKRSGGRVPRKGTSALILAVESGHFELAMQLVEAGADPNDQRSGYGPLHILSWVRKPDFGDNPAGDPSPRGSGKLSSLDFVEAMIKAGADPNLKLKNGKGGRASLNHKGATPLLLAAKTADLPLIQRLMESGADPLITNVTGTTALMAAAGVGVKAVGEEAGTVTEVCQTIEYLIEQGLDVNTVDDNLETAVHGAAYRNYPEAIDLLAARGAKAEVWDHKNKWGWTPVMIGEGHRPGSFKPSPPTVAALEKARITSP